MKIKVSKSELYNKLKMVSKVVGPHKTLPVLENYMFDIDQTLKITGSDGEGLITANVELIEFEGKSKFIVDKTLFNALSELPEQPIEISIDDKFHITVTYTNGQFDIQGLDAETYPILSMSEDNQTVSVERKELIEGLKTVIPFTANDELRPVMNGVYIDSKDGKLAFVSTDANVLALREYKTGEDVFSANIPAKACKIIISILSEFANDNVNIVVSNKTISVETDKYSCIYRLIEGRYPNYRNVLPKSHITDVEFDRSELLGLLKRVSLFSNISSKLLKLHINPGTIKIDAQDVDYNISATETIFVDVNGETMTIGFKASRLIDIISSMNSEKCIFQLLSPDRAGIILPVDIEGVTMLIMPMLINS